MAWKYLLSPTFQVVNTAGKPATGGYIEVYVQGTRDRYYCASDFDGTLHPFKIPLDSLGANIVLADDSQTYDVYVYNRYGSLIMSRYDVPTVRGKDSAYSGDVSDATATFTKDEGDTSEISSGSTLKVLLTKISKFFASLKRVAFTGSYNDLSDKPDVKKGKLHRIGVRMVQEGDPSPKPSTDWVIDLESPNSNEPDGYDRLTVSKAIELHENGEIFIFTNFGSATLDSSSCWFYESSVIASSNNITIKLLRSYVSNDVREVQGANLTSFGNYVGILDWNSDDEYWRETFVTEGSDELRQNKIHRYSFGDATIDGETPVYGSWLIDLEKPDPNGPEGYARVTPYEFWKAVARNNEVPVYLQDKNSDNSLTYAYLSRADVTKSGSMVTNVFMFFVRSGYGNNLGQSYGFKFTKLNGSDYIQKAAYDTDFDALSETGDSGTTKPTFTTAQVVANIVSGERLKVMLGKIAKWFTELATVAFSGSYSDLINKPSIPAAQVSSDWNANSGVEQILNKPNLATVATSGSYSDLTNKPTTVNVNQADSNTDTSSFTFVNGHIYHLTMYLQGSLMEIDSSASGTGYVVAYIGSSSTLARYICSQFVDIQNGRITTNDIRLPIDWKAENISSVSGDNQLHIKVIFHNQTFAFTSTSVYDLTLMGTDLSGA